jgi:hypothetical protein
MKAVLQAAEMKVKKFEAKAAKILCRYVYLVLFGNLK